MTELPETTTPQREDADSQIDERTISPALAHLDRLDPTPSILPRRGGKATGRRHHQTRHHRRPNSAWDEIQVLSSASGSAPEAHAEARVIVGSMHCSAVPS
jgi:hypothetical protein